MIFEINDYDDFLESGDELDGNSRDITLDQTECQLAKMVIALESAEEMYELDLRAAELKCYAESGNDDSFFAYVEAAGNDLNQKTDSLIKRIWEKVVQFFTQLKEKVFKKAGKDLEKADKVRCPKPFAFLIKKFKSLWGSVKSAIASAKTNLDEHPGWKKLMLAVTTAVAAVGSVVLIKHRKFEKGVAAKVAENTRNENGPTLYGGAPNPNAGKVSGEELTEITGREFNEAWYEMDKACEYIMKYSHGVCKGLNSDRKKAGLHTLEGQAFHDKVDPIKAKCLSALGSGLKTVTNKMASIRARKAKPEAANA